MSFALTRVEIPIPFTCRNFHWDVCTNITTVDVKPIGSPILGTVVFTDKGTFFEQNGKRVQFAVPQIKDNRDYCMSSQMSAYSYVRNIFHK